MRRNLLLGITLACLLPSLICTAEAGPIRDALRGKRDGGPSSGSPIGSSEAPRLVEMTYQGTTRSYSIYVPAHLPVRGKHAAVFVFHGGGGNAEHAISASQMVKAADSNDFIAVFPNSGESQWNDGRVKADQSKDDVGFIRAIIEQITRENHVDPARIYTSGISNGGMFSQRLACDAADLFRGYGIVAANMPEDLAPACRPSRPVPLVFFNGVADKIMPFEGGDIKSSPLLGIGGSVLSRDKTAAFWAQQDKCQKTTGNHKLPDTANDDTSVQVESFFNCAGGVHLEFYSIEGGGHNWPGSQQSKRLFTGNVSQDIDATATMIRFFKRYGL